MVSVSIDKLEMEKVCEKVDLVDDKGHEIHESVYRGDDV